MMVCPWGISVEFPVETFGFGGIHGTTVGLLVTGLVVVVILEFSLPALGSFGWSTPVNRVWRMECGVRYYSAA